MYYGTALIKEPANIQLIRDDQHKWQENKMVSGTIFYSFYFFHGLDEKCILGLK